MLVVTTKINGHRQLVNEGAITNIEDCGNYTILYFIGGGSLTVDDSWSDIQEKLNCTTPTLAAPSETITPAGINTNNVPDSGRVLLDLTALMADEFRYDSETERDVLLKGNSVYLICCKYSAIKSLMASNIRSDKPVFDGCGNGDKGWVYYTRISAGQIIESDGINVPPSRSQKIRDVLNNLLEKYK